jgi:hypothetical protein
MVEIELRYSSHIRQAMVASLYRGSRAGWDSNSRSVPSRKRSSLIFIYVKVHLTDGLAADASAHCRIAPELLGVVTPRSRRGGYRWIGEEDRTKRAKRFRFSGCNFDLKTTLRKLESAFAGFESWISDGGT